MSTDNKLVLASANPGKIKELQQMLDQLGIEVIPQTELNIPDIEETGLSFVENSILKARNAAALSGLPAIADDSGLEVDYLQGAPGIYSARFAGANATDASNRDKLLEQLAGVPAEQRTARYQTVIVYMRHADDPTPIICQGTWEGSIACDEKGDGGFGYDPIFNVPETGCRAAELDKDRKNRLSHRGKAMARLLRRRQNQQPVLHPPPLSLYIHIPWCVRKCPYCDFNSHQVGDRIPEQAYVRKLIADLRTDKHWAQGRKLHSIFFGGGTPSLFSAFGKDSRCRSGPKSHCHRQDRGLY